MPERRNKERKKKRATVKRNADVIPSKKVDQQGTAPKPPRWKRTLRFGLTLVWNIYAFLGVLCTIWIAVWPHVYVYPSAALDPNNPMFTPFVVRNEGYFAIRDVKFSCAVKYLESPGGTLIVAMKEFKNSFTNPKQVSRVITRGEEASELLPLSAMEHNQFNKADIAVRLEYKPFRLWPFYEREELHRFEVKRKGEQWHWFPQPLDK